MAIVDTDRAVGSVGSPPTWPTSARRLRAMRNARSVPDCYSSSFEREREREREREGGKKLDRNRFSHVSMRLCLVVVWVVFHYTAFNFIFAAAILQLEFHWQYLIPIILYFYLYCLIIISISSLFCTYCSSVDIFTINICLDF